MNDEEKKGRLVIDGLVHQRPSYENHVADVDRLTLTLGHPLALLHIGLL